MARGMKLPEVLTIEECQALASVANPRYLTGLRDRCMIRLMLNTGLRSSECLNLKLADIDWNSGQMMVRQGKGKKDRALWINPDVLALLQRWRARRPGVSDHLFTTSKGRPVSGRALRAMVERQGLKAGITKHVHPHTLRHSFATEVYRQTKDIRRVQKMLGHADLSTTMIYTHIVDEDVETAMNDFIGCDRLDKPRLSVTLSAEHIR